MTDHPRSERPLLRNAFIVLLGLNGLIELLAAALMFVDLPGAMALFQVEYNEQLDILGLIMGNALLFVGGIAALGVAWTWGGKREGVVCGIAVGLFLVSFAVLAVALFGDWGAVAVDGVRGGLLVGLGAMLLRTARPSA